MKSINLKLVCLISTALLLTTGCSGGTDQETSDFIENCNAKPGCGYKVLSNQCVCDKTHEYTPGP